MQYPEYIQRLFYYSFIALITAIITSGMYIKKRSSLCHRPSFAMNVPENSSLSDIMNRVKQTIARIKQMMLIIPTELSLFLNESIAASKGRKRK